MTEELALQAAAMMEEFGQKAGLKEGDILVVGCSTSEVLGEQIGTHSSPETAGVLFEAIHDYTRRRRVWLAAQCCEHLNRAVYDEKLK